MKVIIQVQKIVPAFSASVASVIAREMGIPQTDVYSFVTFYAMLSREAEGQIHHPHVQERAVPREGREGDRAGSGGSFTYQDG
ncbi:MAG: NAD(P)H-dependent oxidoreductase subunit E [Clostridium sp.]